MNMQSIEKTLVKLIDSFEGQLPREQLGEMRNLTTAGEPGVAFENLCVQLFEYDIHVAPEVLNELRTVGLAMTIKATYWERLYTNSRP
jgi:hypothetical protein